MCPESGALELLLMSCCLFCRDRKCASLGRVRTIQWRVEDTPDFRTSLVLKVSVLVELLYVLYGDLLHVILDSVHPETKTSDKLGAVMLAVDQLGILLILAQSGQI